MVSVGEVYNGVTWNMVSENKKMEMKYEIWEKNNWKMEKKKM